MSQKGFAPILIVIILATALGGYFVYQNQSPLRQGSVGQAKPTPLPQSAPTPATSDSSVDLPPLKEIEKGHPKLESVLYQLTKSNNYNEFAKTHGLTLIDNQIRVVIELTDSNYTLQSKFGVEESRYQNLLRARVSIDKILELVEDPNIKFIRMPSKPVLLRN